MADIPGPKVPGKIKNKYLVNRDFFTMAYPMRFGMLSNSIFRSKAARKTQFISAADQSIKEKTMLIKKISPAFVCLALLLASCHMAMANTITKSPNRGDYWNPLSGNGTYVYADSFVATTDGVVTNLGTWLNGGSSDLVFQVYGSKAGNAALGPDSAAILASSATLSGLSFDNLTFVDGGPITDFGSLMAGNTYWFAASTVGLGGSGAFSVGGHIQNSEGIVDNGTFWYSNVPDGSSYAGANMTPEIAFTVTISPTGNVPEPATPALLALGLFGLALANRRRDKYTSASSR